MQLYRILIADDEPYIVQCIHTLIEEAEQERVEIYRAFSGEEALAVMSMRKIDILITDIQMPGMSGIELARVTRERWPDLQTLILTAHADFELARQAIDCGVVGYVLKTDSDAHILQEVQKAMGTADASLARANLLLHAHTEPQTAACAQRQAMQALLAPAKGYSPAEASQALGVLGLPAGQNSLLLMLAQWDGTADRARYSAAIKRLMGHYLLRHVRSFACEAWQDRLVWLIAPEARHSGEGWFEGVLEAVQESCIQTLRLSPSILWARSAPAQLPEKMTACIAFMDRMQAHQPGYIHRLDAQPYLEEDWTGHILLRLNQYIDENIFGDLSLSTLAEYAGYNATYLSRLFHEKTGTLLSAHIAGHKLLRIGELLRDKSRSINEIAYEAGFDSPSNFGRFIKRLTGMTPLAYRASLLKKNQSSGQNGTPLIDTRMRERQ